MSELANPSELDYLQDLQQHMRDIRKRAAAHARSGPFPMIRGAGPARWDTTDADVSPAGQDSPEAADLVEATVEAAIDRAEAILDTSDAQQPKAPPVERSLAEELGTAWAALHPHSRSSLIQGEGLRRDMKRRAILTGEECDFALVVIAYCRALELELHRRIFIPFKQHEAADGFKAQWADADVRKSADLLERFRSQDAPLGLGQMAACLGNLGCGEAGGRHTLASFLRSHLSDATEFCAGRYPRWLGKLAVGYRNRAAHIAAISEGDCDKARSYLLSDPRRLLIKLIELAPPR